MLEFCYNGGSGDEHACNMEIATDIESFEKAASVLR